MVVRSPEQDFAVKLHHPLQAKIGDSGRTWDDPATDCDQGPQSKTDLAMFLETGGDQREHTPFSNVTNAVSGPRFLDPSS
jgi:hypothetical protein